MSIMFRCDNTEVHNMEMNVAFCRSPIHDPGVLSRSAPRTPVMTCVRWSGKHPACSTRNIMASRSHISNHRTRKQLLPMSPNRGLLRDAGAVKGAAPVSMTTSIYTDLSPAAPWSASDVNQSAKAAGQCSLVVPAASRDVSPTWCSWQMGNGCAASVTINHYRGTVTCYDRTQGFTCWRKPICF